MRRTHSYGIPCCAVLFLAAHVARSAQAQATVVGQVTNQAQTPIRDAEVIIEKIPAVTRTDSSGRFHFRSLPPGLHRVDVRRLGYAPTSIDVQLKDQDTVTVRVQLVQRAQPLPEVPVAGERPAASGSRFGDFERYS